MDDTLHRFATAQNSEGWNEQDSDSIQNLLDDLDVTQLCRVFVVVITLKNGVHKILKQNLTNERNIDV